MTLFRTVFVVIFLAFSPCALAQDLLTDQNGDGVVRLLAFGDSITFGVGDGVPSNAYSEEVPRTDGSQGYPDRILTWGGIQVVNGGSPGELLSAGGVGRFVELLQTTAPDMAFLMEGANDAGAQLPPSTYRIFLQRAVNIAGAIGVPLILGTLTPTCCDRDGQNFYVSLYNGEILDLADIHSTRIVPVRDAWQRACPVREVCSFLNRPEGLHPNTAGYDLLAQVVLGTLFEVDLFSPGGSGMLEEALGLEVGMLIDLSDGAV